MDPLEEALGDPAAGMLQALLWGSGSNTWGSGSNTAGGLLVLGATFDIFATFYMDPNP